MTLQLDPSTLTTFGSAAAGHDGVLSDPSGALVIKPCTPSEIAFYESARTNHPDFAKFMPTYMGSLTLNKAASEGGKDEATAATLALADVGPMKGKKLDTELSIVLENVAASFKKPNILDIKLGAQLWDENAKPEKRARLDKVANETTSGSLGFRNAGMRVWQGDQGEVQSGKRKEEGLVEFDSKTRYKVYNKLYGRQFSAEDAIEGFEEYILHPGGTTERALEIVKRFRAEVKEIEDALSSKESRMYSASILFVYEGDMAASDVALAALKESEPSAKADIGKTEADVEDDDDDEVAERSKLYAIKLIDFAHANWTPGKGPDENALKGIRSTGKIFDDMIKKLEEKKS